MSKKNPQGKRKELRTVHRNGKTHQQHYTVGSNKGAQPPTAATPRTPTTEEVAKFEREDKALYSNDEAQIVALFRNKETGDRVFDELMAYPASPAIPLTPAVCHAILDNEKAPLKAREMIGRVSKDVEVILKAVHTAPEKYRTHVVYAIRSEKALSVLAFGSDEKIACAAARNEHLRAEDYRKLSQSNDPKIRAAAVANPQATIEELSEFLKDDEAAVRAAALRKALPEEVLAHYRDNDPDEQVRESAVSALQHKEYDRMMRELIGPEPYGMSRRSS